MSRQPDPIEVAIIAATVQVLARRAAALRQRAAGLITTTTDAAGKPVKINTPEAVVMTGTAEFFEGCVADLEGAA